jgi:hypothetical protein
MRRSRHSALTERTNRSACALQFGAQNGVLMTRTADVSSSCRTAALHLRWRSQIRNRCAQSTPSLASVSSRTICRMKASIRMWCRADDADAPRLQFDDKQRVMRDEAASRPDLRHEEICRDVHANAPARRSATMSAAQGSAGRRAASGSWQWSTAPRGDRDSLPRLGCACSPNSDSRSPFARRAGESPGAREAGQADASGTSISG